MNITATPLSGLIVIDPRVFSDARGFFTETFHATRFREAGLPEDFVQDNHAHSLHGVLRGLHYQIEHPQGKLIRCVQGEVFDVAVDLRQSSPSFGRWFALHLSAANHRQVYLPPGLAHGLCVLSESADVIYKCTDYYYPEHERTILWNDPQLAIDWPITDPILSNKDRNGLPFAEAERYPGG